MFKQMIEKNADSDAQLASHNTSICKLEVQMGQISQALNSRPKRALPSDTVVNPKGGNTTRHAMTITTRSGRGGNAPTSSQTQLVDDEKVVEEEEIPNNIVQENDKVRIDIDDMMEETQEDVNPSRDHVIDMPELVVQKAKAPLPKTPPLYPQRLAKKNGENQFKKFIDMIKNFVILDCEVEYEVSIILGRPFLAKGKALVDVEAGELTFRAVLLNFDDDKMDAFMEYINSLQGIGSYNYAPRNLSLDLENRKTPPTKPSIEEPPILELKPLSPHLKYESLGLCSTLPVILSSYLTNVHMDSTLAVLHKRKKAIGWTLVDIRGISPSFCMNKINLEEDAKPFIEHQRRLNEAMQEEGIVIGHKISKKVIVVDKAKIEVISKLPPPTSVKGVISFLGHAGFYTRFIKDFSKVVNPLCKLLEKYAKFHFNDDFMRAFEFLKFKLTTTPIITAPNWSIPFKLMCDVSDMAVGEVLRQRINKIFHPVYYASKTMNNAQVNYTIIEKELLVIVFAIEKFRPYLMGAKVIVHMDHAALCYLMSKKDSKARLMR
ncbi:uncharacterized protein [Nicotiana tomentosiformis]|uniref:uncharacterized protein n=1 Tax=Nicotiana tomentosiformis TaxID=4098 RepID=UPI00388CB1C8